MGGSQVPSTIAYQNPSWAEQSHGVTQSGGSGAVPSSPNTMMDSLGEATKQANAMVEAAAKQVQSTPQYSSQHSSNPAMPVPKPTLFGGASVHNLDNQQPQTRAGARNKAVGQIAALAAGTVGAWVKKKEAEKTQAIAQDVNRVLELQKGIDESNQVLQADPNNQAAKMQLQKNTSLLGATLNGKNGKEIAKAFDVTFGEGAKEQAKAGSDKDKQHKQAMTAAMKQAQEEEKAQKFEGQLPSQMGPNPAYQAAQANLQAVQKQADTLLKTYSTMAGHVMQQENVQSQNASREHVAETNATSREKVATDKVSAEIEANKQKHKDKMSEIGAQGANRMAQIKEVKKMGDNSKGQKMAEDFAKSTDAAMVHTRDALSKIDIELNKPENKQSENAGAAKALQSQKAMLTDTLNTLQQQKDQAIMEMHSDPDAGAMFNLIGGMDDQ